MSVDVNGRRHVPAGVSDGGRFVATVRTEPAVSLESTSPAPGITEDDDDMFANGYCHVLAKALHERTGWPMVVVSDGPDGVVGWVHAGVRRPDGKILDVRGETDETWWVSNWGDVIDAYADDFDEFDGDLINGYDWTDDMDPEPADPAVVQRAAVVADLLLAHLHP